MPVFKEKPPAIDVLGHEGRKFTAIPVTDIVAVREFNQAARLPSLVYPDHHGNMTLCQESEAFSCGLSIPECQEQFQKAGLEFIEMADPAGAIFWVNPRAVQNVPHLTPLDTR